MVIHCADERQQHEVDQRRLAVVRSIGSSIGSQHGQLTLIAQFAHHAQKVGLVILPKGLLGHIEHAQNDLDHKDDDEYLARCDFTDCLVQRRSYSVVMDGRCVDYNMSLRPNVLGLAHKDRL